MKKIITLFAIAGMVLALAPAAQAAAISIDNSADSGRLDAAVGTITGFTVDGANAHRMLVVGFTGETRDNPASVKYGGVDLTEIATIIAPGPTYSSASIWVLVDPAGGTANIEVTAGSDLNRMHFGVMSLYADGALSVSDTDEKAATTGTSDTLSLTLAETDDFVFTVGECGRTDGISTADLASNLFALGSGDLGGYSSSGDYESGVSSITYSWSANDRYAMAGVAITAAGGGGSTPGTLIYGK
jgi:hypothetical protein